MTRPAALPSDERGDPDIRLLQPEDVRRLRLGHHRRTADAVRHLIADFPNRSVWAPETLEFALVAPWRHRHEVAVIDEIAAVKHTRALLRAAIGNCRRAGDAIILMLEMQERRHPSFYARLGMVVIEDVITYELLKPRPRTRPATITFTPVAPADPRQRDALLGLDHAAFPWLWWNSAEEFQVYSETPGTRLYLGTLEQRPVAYLGVSVFPGWGHLDRIAIDPAVQGRGLGHEALEFAIATMHRAGARRIALSTQLGNERSQRLYERVGFRRSSEFDYRLYGAPLRAPALPLTTMNGTPATRPAAEDGTPAWAAASDRSSS